MADQWSNRPAEKSWFPNKQTLCIECEFVQIMIDVSNNKNNLLAGCGTVKQTTKIPIAIARPMKRTYASTAVPVGCVEHQEYCLIKIE